MPSLATNVADLATRVSTEIKAVRTLVNGNQAGLTALSTTAKSNLVAAINELYAALADASGINDAVTSTDSGWSSTKTSTEITARISAIVDAAPGTLDTLNELAAALGDDPAFATTVTGQIATKANDNAVVHLTGAETIAGTKTFSSAPSVPDASFTTGKVTGLDTALAGKAAVTHSHVLTDLSNSTAVGRSVLGAADAAAGRAAIGAGTSNLTIGTTGTTAKAGDYQPTAANISDATAVGRSVLTALDAATARNAIGAGTPAVAASATVSGVVELATAAEATTGTDDVRAVTPAGLAAVAATKANTADVGNTATDFVAVFNAGLV